MLLSQLAMAFPSVEAMKNNDASYILHNLNCLIGVPSPSCFGFGFSDKPQPGYGFDYTLGEITADSQTCQSSINPVHIQQLFARFP
ncbi:uncharacterized protein LOC112009319 isoform X4 [Quercus suber]|uniref:uncharacterized protein LOC112009319 isoform X4 n=1 Tax=Quercus suber TaxID=58331 RepID=UPI0032DED00F